MIFKTKPVNDPCVLVWRWVTPDWRDSGSALSISLLYCTLGDGVRSQADHYITAITLDMVNWRGIITNYIVHIS